jgi:hypothetical protein
MADTTGQVRKNWKTIAAIVGAIFAIIVGFQQRLAEITLEARFFLVGLAGILVVTFVARMVHIGPKSKGTKTSTIRRLLIFGGGLAVLAACTLSLFLLFKTATFHNIRILKRTGVGSSTVGQIEIQPAHRPTTLTLTLSTPQAGPTIVQEAPRDWNDDDRVSWKMQNESPHGVTLILEGFKSPQVFGIWYRMSGDASALEIGADSNPAEVPILRDHQLHAYYLNIKIFGGVLCILGLLYWSWESSWFRGTK